MSELSNDHSFCTTCGMLCALDEYHPHLACLAFKGCGDSLEVSINLDDVRQAERERILKALPGYPATTIEGRDGLEYDAWGVGFSDCLDKVKQAIQGDTP